MECLEGGFPEPFSERRHLRRQAFEGTVDMKIGAMNKTKCSHDILLPGWISAFGLFSVSHKLLFFNSIDDMLCRLNHFLAGWVAG